MQLKNKIVLVTGASKGIGRATAIEFSKQNCKVVINFKSDLKAAEETLAECNKYSSENMIYQADLTDEASITEMISKIKDHHSHLDVLVNNAGIFDEEDSPTNLVAFDTLYKNNFLSIIFLTKQALDIMDQGRIINVSSVHAKSGQPRAAAYSAFKAALENYTKSLAIHLAPKILVNAVAPGRVATQMWDNPDQNKQKILGRAHLIERMIQPEEIAEVIVFLAKNDAICGEILTIDGGMSLK